jgi:20S proteasome alpha/beta subunit
MYLSLPLFQALRRLPKNKRMTIALGLLAPNGVVIAADTQETMGWGGVKYSGWKIQSRRHKGGERSFAATGSGDAATLDALHQDLGDQFAKSGADVQEKWKGILESFYSNHVRQFNEPTRPLDIQSVCGLSWKNPSQNPELFATSFNRLRRIKQSVAVGAGEQSATELLNLALPPKGETNVLQLAAIAAFTIFHVKETVDGCGRGTHITILRDGGAWYVKPEVIEELEVCFRKLADFEKAAINFVLNQGAPYRIVMEGSMKELNCAKLPLRDDSLLQIEGEAVFG